MKLGITGLAGSGKSTVFSALTRTVVDPAKRGENLIGTIHVPDERVDILSKMYQPRKTIFAQVEYFLPGRRAGKADGGDQNFWTPVRDCDALIHVVRNFKGYGADAPNPGDDVDTLDQELILADQVVVEKRLERMVSERKKNRNFDPEEQALLEKCLECLEGEKPLRLFPDLAFAPILRGFAFLSAKPMLMLFNNEDEDEEMPGDFALQSLENSMVMRGKLEQELAQMSGEEAAEFLAEFNIADSAMDRVIRASYKLLGRISFFTVGEDEVRAWTIAKDTDAVAAAGAIHTDIQKGFIRAEVVSYRDLMDAGAYAEARKAGTVRLEGKTYTVQDGDIINFRFNV